MNEYKRWINLLSAGAVLLVEAAWMFLWLYTDLVKSRIPESANLDVLYYISSVLLAFLVFVSLHAFFDGRVPVAFSENKRRESFLELSALILFAAAGCSAFLWEKNVIYAGDQYMPLHESRWTEGAFLLVSALLLCLICYLWRRKDIRSPKTVKLWPLYLILAVLAGYAVYQPNSLNVYYNLYHADAYFNSIYRVVHLEPYDAANACVYGFYGILVGPVVKLLGGSFRACVAVMAVLMSSCMLCYFYVLNKITPHPLLRILGSIGILSALTASSANIYLQTYPGRLLFPGYILALIVWGEQQERRKERFWRIAVLILLTLSMVWSLESGIGCVLAFVGSEIVRLLQENSLREGSLWKKAAGIFAYLPAAFLGAYGIVNLYDLAVAGKLISLKDFLFPFAGNPYVNDLRLPLDTFPSFWMMVCLLIFASVEVVLLSTALCGSRKKNPRLIYLTGCTILGAVQMIYYVNRSVRANLFLVLPACVLMIVCLIEELASKPVWERECLGNGILRAVSASQVLVLFLTAVMGIEGSFFFGAERRKTRDMAEVYHYLEFVQNEIPKNTPGIGIGVPELYSYLGWDTGYYGIDAPDFPVAPEAKEAAVKLLSQSEYVFVNNDSLLTIIEHTDGRLEDFFDTHEIQCSYGFGVGEYTLYKRI